MVQALLRASPFERARLQLAPMAVHMDLLFRGSGFGRLLRFPSPHALGQRQPDAMARHGVTAIEVGEHQGSRICVRHDHLGNQRREDRQQQRVRQGAGECRDANGQDVDRDAQPVQSERGLIDHRPWAEKSPVQIASGSIARS